MMRSHNLAGITLLCAMAVACTPGGYYDANGVYRDANGTAVVPAHVEKQVVVVANPAVPVAPAVTTVTRVYTQAGYYDRTGVFIADLNSGPRVAAQYLPPRGECRVWYFTRTPDDQPLAEPCSSIYTDVPDNAYVIYGG